HRDRPESLRRGLDHGERTPDQLHAYALDAHVLEGVRGIQYRLRHGHRGAAVRAGAAGNAGQPPPAATGKAGVLMGRAAGTIGNGLKYALLCLYLAAVVFPMCWVVYSSGKSTQEFYKNPVGLPKVLTAPNQENLATLTTNYGKAWIGSHFSSYFVNSLKVVAISLFFILLLGSMAAYVLARFEFRGRNLIYVLFLSGLLIPMQLILIPLFFQYSNMGEWLTRLLAPPVRALGLGHLTISFHDSHAGLILIYIAASLPFTVFTLTAFFRTLPGERREAAMIDGASEYRIFFRVMMPLARPGLVTVAIFNFLGLWNEYL